MTDEQRKLIHFIARHQKIIDGIEAHFAKNPGIYDEQKRLELDRLRPLVADARASLRRIILENGPIPRSPWIESGGPERTERELFDEYERC